jgi:hypothetical protein
MAGPVLFVEPPNVLKKSAVVVLLFLVGACLGIFAGYKLSSARVLAHEWRSFDNPEGRDFSRVYDLIARLKLVDIGSATRIEDPKQSPERRREYLNLILDTAQKGRTGVTNPSALTLIDVETGVTYVRLAMVEEAAGNLPASQTWMQKAQTILKQTGWKDCSESHLKKLVAALNKQDSLL